MNPGYSNFSLLLSSLGPVSLKTDSDFILVFKLFHSKRGLYGSIYSLRNRYITAHSCFV